MKNERPVFFPDLNLSVPLLDEEFDDVGIDDAVDAPAILPTLLREDATAWLE